MGGARLPEVPDVTGGWVFTPPFRTLANRRHYTELMQQGTLAHLRKYGLEQGLQTREEESCYMS